MIITYILGIFIIISIMYIIMWSLPDRILLNKYYKIIGNQVNTNCKILNIGGDIYNIFDYYMFNKKINYWILDIKSKYHISNIFSIKNGYLETDLTKALKNYPEKKKFFDIIFSFGVLGYYKFNKHMQKKYIKSVYNLLNKNGIFLLKIDDHRMENWNNKYQIDMNLFKKYFNKNNFDKIPKKFIEMKNNKKLYSVYCFIKK